ncbi:helix-turn-helix domain-containing protein [Nocardia niwae]|uniref:Helix-turn-helix transcriptional regulator n=1 Tax=Nocardia niwae TaxID=626084 RepID=A0ABV2XHL4_9NOCA
MDTNNSSVSWIDRRPVPGALATSPPLWRAGAPQGCGVGPAPGTATERRSREHRGGSTDHGFRSGYARSRISCRGNRFRGKSCGEIGTTIGGRWAMYMTTGEVIRRIRKSVGMTQTELGALINFSQPAVSGLERGGPASHDVRVLRLVARALGVPLAILVVESDREADVDRRNFFRAGASVSAGAAMMSISAPANAASASASAGKVGASDVEAIIDSVNQIHELDLVVGGDRLCRVAANQVRYVEQLLDHGSYTEEVGRALTSAAAEMMTAAGWVHYDAGRPDDARRYYADAANAANAAGDGIAAAHALGNASCLMASRPGDDARGNPLAVQYAQAGARASLRDGGPRLRALLAIREAEAHGVRGDKSAMTAAISRAHRAYESTRGHDPDWVYLPEAEFVGGIGWAQMRLGEHSQATSNLQAAIESSAAWPRERAAWQVHLAENFATSGDAARSCALLADNYETIAGLASTRLHQRIDAIANTVRSHARVPEVREFLARRAAQV